MSQESTLVIKAFQVNPIGVNCYVVSDATHEECIIDPGCMNDSEWNDIHEYIETNHLQPRHLLCTHLHFDHILGCGYPYRDYGLELEASIRDKALYDNLDSCLARFGLPPHSTPTLPPLTPISETDVITFGTHQFTVIETPGHSQGGLCYYCKEEDLLFSGDTLFQGSIGRSDFPESSYADLIHSITDKLLLLPDTTNVLCGHGGYTTIKYERHYNPFL